LRLAELRHSILFANRTRARDAPIPEGYMAGRYVDLVVPWHETRILNCSFCGKMIAGRFWHDDSWPAEKFCEPSCPEVKTKLEKVASPKRRRHTRHAHRS
jgi:hypothetical protein